jgi:methionyl aminopeptidase
VHEAIIERGGYPSTLNYNGYKKSCCTSVNEVICHGIPDQRELKDGDIVNLDVSIFKDGFHSDLDETVAVGNVDDAGLRLIKTARECLDKAIAIGNITLLSTLLCCCSLEELKVYSFVPFCSVFAIS